MLSCFVFIIELINHIYMQNNIAETKKLASQLKSNASFLETFISEPVLTSTQQVDKMKDIDTICAMHELFMKSIKNKISLIKKEAIKSL